MTQIMTAMAPHPENADKTSSTPKWHHLLHPSLGQELQSLAPQQAIIDCQMGSNPFGPPISLDHLKILVEPHTYLKPQSSDDLAYSLGRFLDLDPRYLALNSGSTHSVSTLLTRLFKPDGKTMLGISPQYTHAVSEWIYFGGQYTTVPLLELESNESPMEKLINAVSKKKPDALFLDNPNNPTGYFFELNEIFELLCLCKTLGCFCVIDEAYIDYIERAHSAIYLVEEFDNLIVTRSFSKGMGMAALRIGYTVSQPNIVSTIEQLTLPYAIATPSLYIAQHVLDQVDLERYLQHSAQFVATSKHELISACINAGFTVPTTHPNIPLFSVVHRNIDAQAFFRKINVITTPGQSFYIDGQPPLPDFARLRVPETARELHQLCQRLHAQT